LGGPPVTHKAFTFYGADCNCQVPWKGLSSSTGPPPCQQLCVLMVSSPHFPLTLVFLLLQVFECLDLPASFSVQSTTIQQPPPGSAQAPTSQQTFTKPITRLFFFFFFFFMCTGPLLAGANCETCRTKEVGSIRCAGDVYPHLGIYVASRTAAWGRHFRRTFDFFLTLAHCARSPNLFFQFSIWSQKPCRCCGRLSLPL